MSMYENEAIEDDDFSFRLDDLLLGRVLTPEQLVGLKPEQVELARASLRSAILHSTEVNQHLKNQMARFVDRINRLDDIIIIIIGGGGGGMYRSQLVGAGLGQIGRPRLPLAGSLYAQAFGSFDDFLIEKFLSPKEAASLNASQLRVLAAMIKAEILFSPEVGKILTAKVAEGLK